MTGRDTVEVAACLLEHAATLVQLGWTTDANARLADGTPCSPEQRDAACWCAQGALTAASHLMGIWTQRGDYQDHTIPAPEYTERLRILNQARTALRKAITENKHPMSLMAVSITLCITNWNDDEAGSGEVVARTMKRAAAILRDAQGQVVATLRIAAGPAPEPNRRCWHCGGTGTVRTEDGRRRRCDRCAGTGRTPTVAPDMVVCE